VFDNTIDDCVGWVDSRGQRTVELLLLLYVVIIAIFTFIVYPMHCFRAPFMEIRQLFFCDIMCAE